jgi:hypothetical protein
LHATGYQLRNNLAADVSGCSDDEDTIHLLFTSGRPGASQEVPDLANLRIRAQPINRM